MKNLTTARHSAPAHSQAGAHLASRFLAGAAGASLVLLALSLSASAQSVDAAQLQAETRALDAQLRSLESKMRRTEMQPAPVPARSDKGQAAADEPSPFADKKLHIGGVTVTPGGFLAMEGLSRQKSP